LIQRDVLEDKSVKDDHANSGMPRTTEKVD
jgi:hypothetical protein